jgi:hypothetical protein
MRACLPCQSSWPRHLRSSLTLTHRHRLLVAAHRLLLLLLLPRFRLQLRLPRSDFTFLLYSEHYSDNLLRQRCVLHFQVHFRTFQDPSSVSEPVNKRSFAPVTVTVTPEECCWWRGEPATGLPPSSVVGGMLRASGCGQAGHAQHELS